LHHLVAIGQFEFVRKRLRHPSVYPQRETHSVTIYSASIIQ
jgi:hypothetical protein